MSAPEGQHLLDGVFVLYEISGVNSFQLYSSLGLAQSALKARVAELVAEGEEIEDEGANYVSFYGDSTQLVIDQYRIDDGAWHDAY